jgi:Right handed beta helix region
MQKNKELEVVSDDEEENAVPSTSDQNLWSNANADHNSRAKPDDEPIYRVAWDSSSSKRTSGHQSQKTTLSSSSLTIKKAEELKEQGNAAYKNGHDTAALTFYQEALQHCNENEESTHLQATLHSNIAAVFLKLNRPSDATIAAKQAHTLRPDWPRPLHRLADAHLLCGQYIEAVQACQKGEILCQDHRNSDGHTEFTPVLDRIALKAASSSSASSYRGGGGGGALVGFTGRQLEVRSAGDEAWLGRPAPHIPELDGPLNEETALPSDDLSTTTTTAAINNDGASLNISTTKALPSTSGAVGTRTSSPPDTSISARADALVTFHHNSNYGENKRTSFRSIQEAVSAAQDGDRILLLKGVHNGMGQSININKRILIEGEGDLGETVIDQRANCPTFRITRGGVVIRNLDIDHTGFREALLIEGKAAVTPLIENCILKCSGDDVVNTAGEARPLFRRCVITAKKCGIRAFEKSSVTLESCIIEKCGEQAIKAMEYSKIDATLCTLCDCQEDGVVVMDNAIVSLLACTIQGNEGPGVDCSGQGKAEIRGGEISKNDGGGIFLWDASIATVDGARLDGGRCPVILIDEKGRINATSCVIKGKIHASEEAWQGIFKGGTKSGGTSSRDGENILKNKLVEAVGWTSLPEEEGPFRFVPNKYTRKQ